MGKDRDRRDIFSCTPPVQFKMDMEKKMFWEQKEFWKDVCWTAVALCIIFIVYIVIEYWPDITEGFNRGWNSR